MGIVEILARGAGAVVAVQVAVFRTDRPVLVVAALLLLALLLMDIFRPVRARHR